MREAAQLRLGSLFFAYKELFSIKNIEKICVCQKKAVSLQTILESEDKFDCLRPL